MDISTLVVNTCVSAAFSMTAMFYVWRVHQRDPAIRNWMLAFLLLGLACALIAASRWLAMPRLIALANPAAVGGLLLMRRGTAQFARRPLHPWLAWLALPVMAAVSLVWGEWLPDYRVRVVVFGGVLAGLVALMVADLWHARGGQQRLVVVSMIVLLCAALAMTIARTLHALLAEVPARSLFHGGLVEAGWFVTMQAALFFAPFGFLLMTSQRLQQRLDRLANEDELTGVLNRRAFLGRALMLLADRAQSQPAALLVLDLDRFKALNDSHGHAAGDAALQQVAQRIAVELRPQDLFARVGGEEFWVLLPGTDRMRALQVAERLREAIEQTAVRHGNAALQVTASIGLSTVRDADITAALAAADGALYSAKRDGRNRVASAA